MPKIKEYAAVFNLAYLSSVTARKRNSYFKYWKADGSNSVNRSYINVPFMYLICVFFLFMQLCPLTQGSCRAQISSLRARARTHTHTLSLSLSLLITPVYSLMLLLILLHQYCPTCGPSACVMRSAATFVSYIYIYMMYYYTILFNTITITFLVAQQPLVGRASSLSRLHDHI